MIAGQKIAEENLKAAAETREYGRTKDIQERMDKAATEEQRKQEKAADLKAAEALNRQKLAGETLKEMLPYFAKDTTGKIVDPEYAALKERATPGLGEELERAKVDLRNRQLATGLAAYQKASPKEREAYAKAPTSLGVPQDVYDEILKQSGVNVAAPSPATASKAFEGAISKPWQEYQAPPDLSELLTPAPPPSGTEGIAPWLRPEASPTGAMDWRYGGGGPSVDPGRYEKFPGSVEDLIAASGQQPVAEPAPVPVPATPAPAPEGAGFLDELLRKIRGGGRRYRRKEYFSRFPAND